MKTTDLKAGSELDELVAIHVLKWTRCRTPVQSKAEPKPMGWDAGKGSGWHSVGMLPKFSLDRTASGRVIEAVREWLFSRRQRFLRELQWQFPDEPGHSYCAWPDIFLRIEPFHICLAALRTYVGEVLDLQSTPYPEGEENRLLKAHQEAVAHEADRFQEDDEPPIYPDEDQPDIPDGDGWPA